MIYRERAVDGKMSGSLKLGFIIIGTVLLLGVAVKLLGSVLNFVMPFAIVAGIGLVVFSLFSKKALGGGNNRSLR